MSLKKPSLALCGSAAPGVQPTLYVSGRAQGKHSSIPVQEAVGDALDRRWMLCLLLLLERARDKQSFWAQYIDALPRTYGESSL